MASTSRQGLAALTRRLAPTAARPAAPVQLRPFSSAWPARAQDKRDGPSTSGDLKAHRPLADESRGEVPVAQPSRSSRESSVPRLLDSDFDPTQPPPGRDDGPVGAPLGSSASSSSSSSHMAPPIKIDDFSLSTFPQFLHKPHPLLDSADRIDVPPEASAPYGASVHLYNTEKDFEPRPPSASSMVLDAAADAGEGDGNSSDLNLLAQTTSFQKEQIMRFHRHTLDIGRPVKMTGKGKLATYSSLVVVGNGDGLVGFGRGRDENTSRAVSKAFRAAVESMDTVDRFENRTIQRSMTGEWGATKVHLRPRPPGFGLRVPPAVHAVARSVGILDLSASITGSTNPLNVCRAMLSVLWGGANPTGMGDGLGASARRRDLGEGMKTIEQLEVERGRRLTTVADTRR
ncbi:unnamed protein product [Parajaminaea phylloscopi]